MANHKNLRGISHIQAKVSPEEQAATTLSLDCDGFF